MTAVAAPTGVPSWLTVPAGVGLVNLGCWTSPELPGTGQAQSDWAAHRLTEAVDHPPAALHVVTADAGARETLAFWEAAQATGLALASPMAFPWTLANSPTGRISVGLGITGACTTHLAAGPKDEHTWHSVIQDALDDVADGAPAPVLVVRLRGMTPITPAGGSVILQLTAFLVS